ncbi:conserved hypothetical protein [Mesorhizobium sp. ORS 3324]|nr:conserved hypothetical protein [Mesorhizobium sp. ORS 3324]
MRRRPSLGVRRCPDRPAFPGMCAEQQLALSYPITTHTLVFSANFGANLMVWGIQHGDGCRPEKGIRESVGNAPAAGEFRRRAAEARTVRAFQILAERIEPGLTYPAYFLLAHAVEVVLKSYLAADGVSKRDLRFKPYGHDIDYIFTECERRGPVVSDRLMKPLAKQLAHINQDFDLRYPTGFNLAVAGPSSCIPAVDDLIASIAPAVEKAAIMAQLQFAADTQHLRGSKIQWSD